MSKLELKITNNSGYSTVVDVLDFPFRLNRTVFTTSEDRLKTLGGITSTNIKLAKSKRNNRLFVGKGEFNDYNKFNRQEEYKAVMTENGAEIARGTFSFNEGSISFDSYEGTFYDENINWVDKLSDIPLNELGYVDGKPTWLVPFDGAASFNVVNDQTNNETDYVCPTIVYNNTVQADYINLTDEEIWGTFDMTDPDNPIRRTPAFSINDFTAETGYFGGRLGLTFDSFPPAVYYKNLIEKIFTEIGVAIDCSLFNEDWFNKLIMPYVGDDYIYNWKNIASIKAFNLIVNQIGQENFDEVIELIGDDRTGLQPFNEININYADLPFLGGGAGTTRWIDDYRFEFNKESIIKHDNVVAVGTIDKIVAYNKFGIQGQYICPTDGEYTIKVDTDYRSKLTDNINISDGSNPPVWIGASLINSFGTWDANSSSTGSVINSHYGWDDQVLVIRRLNEGGDDVYQNTDEDLYRWMNGENTDFIDNPSDVIAYFSPKRKRIHDLVTPLSENQYMGSPITNFESQVTLNNYTHGVIISGQSKQANSAGSIEVTLDLKKNERVIMYWTNLTNIYGEAAIDPAFPKPYSYAYEPDTNEVELNSNATNNFEITYNCGEYDLNLAQNLPQMTCKDFISSFIKQFNLYIGFEDNTVKLLPQKYFYSNNSYDITSRVVDNTWSSTPLPTPKVWKIGYDVDSKDRLLTTDINSCESTSSGTNSYGNLEFDNPNAANNNVLNELNMFSSTKFIDSNVRLYDNTLDPLNIILTETTPDPVSGVTLIKGIEIIKPANIALNNYVDLQLPSIQSLESFNQKTLGDLTYDYNYNPRLIYHHGTVNQYTTLSNDHQVLVDSPREIDSFIAYDKHWVRVTVSSFDKENELITGTDYPSLRYDKTVKDVGLYETYFENLIQLYNESELFAVNVSLRSIDWNNMNGSELIRYKDQLYRLSQIIDYSPVDNTPCRVTMIKEI